LTKPQELLIAANRALADQTNEAAALEVSDVIVPTFDVFELDSDPRFFRAAHTMLGIFRLVIRHASVPVGEIWEYEEIWMNYVGTATESFQLQVVPNLAGTTAEAINFGTNLLAAGQNNIDLLRSIGTNTAENGRNSNRPFRLYPGMNLQLESNTALAVGDVVDFSGLYNRIAAPRQNAPVNELSTRMTEIEF